MTSEITTNIDQISEYMSDREHYCLHSHNNQLTHQVHNAPSCQIQSQYFCNREQSQQGRIAAHVQRVLRAFQQAQQSATSGSSYSLPNNIQPLMAHVSNLSTLKTILFQQSPQLSQHAIHIASSTSQVSSSQMPVQVSLSYIPETVLPSSFSSQLNLQSTSTTSQVSLLQMPATVQLSTQPVTQPNLLHQIGLLQQIRQLLVNFSTVFPLSAPLMRLEELHEEYVAITTRNLQFARQYSDTITDNTMQELRSRILQPQNTLSTEEHVHLDALEALIRIRTRHQPYFLTQYLQTECQYLQRESLTAVLQQLLQDTSRIVCEKLQSIHQAREELNAMISQPLSHIRDQTTHYLQFLVNNYDLRLQIENLTQLLSGIPEAVLQCILPPNFSLFTYVNIQRIELVVLLQLQSQLTLLRHPVQQYNRYVELPSNQLWSHISQIIIKQQTIINDRFYANPQLPLQLRAMRYSIDTAFKDLLTLFCERMTCETSISDEVQHVLRTYIASVPRQTVQSQTVQSQAVQFQAAQLLHSHEEHIRNIDADHKKFLKILGRLVFNPQICSSPIYIDAFSNILSELFNPIPNSLTAMHLNQKTHESTYQAILGVLRQRVLQTLAKLLYYLPWEIATYVSLKTLLNLIDSARTSLSTATQRVIQECLASIRILPPIQSFTQVQTDILNTVHEFIENTPEHALPESSSSLSTLLEVTYFMHARLITEVPHQTTQLTQLQNLEHRIRERQTALRSGKSNKHNRS